MLVYFEVKAKSPVVFYIAFRAFLALGIARAPETWCGSTKSRQILTYKHIRGAKTSFSQNFGPNVVYFFLNVKFILMKFIKNEKMQD